MVEVVIVEVARGKVAAHNDGIYEAVGDSWRLIVRASRHYRATNLRRKLPHHLNEVAVGDEVRFLAIPAIATASISRSASDLGVPPYQLQYMFSPALLRSSADAPCAVDIKVYSLDRQPFSIRIRRTSARTLSQWLVSHGAAECDMHMVLSGKKTARRATRQARLWLGTTLDGTGNQNVKISQKHVRCRLADIGCIGISHRRSFGQRRARVLASCMLCMHLYRDRCLAVASCLGVHTSAL